MTGLPDDVLLIDKPKGVSSFDVIRTLRRTLGVRKMGHAGTLDPLASGLLIVGVGAGTKKLTEYLKLDKTYEAEIILGESRTTGDVEGELIAEKAVDSIDVAQVRAVLAGMVGNIVLKVPRYSAIKRDGEALYKKARRGDEFEAPVRTMQVHDAVLARIVPDTSRVHIHVWFSVGSGTYIRSLAEEVGRRLGVPATLGNLRRTRIGQYSLKEAKKM